VQITWGPGSLNQSGFAIERSIAGGAFTQIDTVAAGVMSYIDHGLAAGTQYTYRIRAFNAAGFSSYSADAPVSTPLTNANLIGLWRFDESGGTSAADASPN